MNFIERVTRIVTHVNLGALLGLVTCEGRSVRRADLAMSGADL